MRSASTVTAKAVPYRISCAVVLFAFSVLLPITLFSDELQTPDNLSHGKNVIVFGEDKDYEPFSFVDGNGQPSGFGVDLSIALSKEMGLTPVFRMESEDQILQDLQNGVIDATSAVTYSPGLDKKLDFSLIHTTVEYDFFVRKSFPDISQKDLKSLEIIIMKGSIAQDWLRDNGYNHIIEVDTPNRGLELLSSGLHDAMVLPRFAGIYLMNKMQLSNLKPLYINSFDQTWGYVVKDGNSNLLDRINHGLIALKNSGKMDQIREKWFGAQESQTYWYKIRYLLLIVSACACLAAIIAAWSISLTRQVRRKTEELSKSEERLQLALKGADLALWDWDVASGRIIYNDTWAYMLGLDPSKVDPTPAAWESLVHPEDSSRAKKALEDHLAGKTASYEAEYRLKHNSGEWIWVLDRGKVVERGENGGPSRVTGTHLDITSQKKAVDAIIESEEQFKRIVEDAPFPIIIRDMEGLVLYGNGRAEKMFETKRDMVVGKLNVEMFYADPGEKEKINEEFARKRGLKNFEFKVKTYEGREFWTLLNANFIRFKGQKAMYVSYTDITDRKMAEEALKEKTEELDRYFSSSLDLYCIFDSNGYFRRVNNLWESVLGYGTGELENRNILDFVHPDDIAAAKRSIEDMGKSQTAQNFINRCRCRDGTYKYIEWKACPAGTKIFTAARDITERIKDEEEKARLASQIIQINKMEAIGRLAGGVAHDFNNLLTAIKGNIELALMRLNEADPVYSYLRDAEKASNSAEKVARQLLAFSRKQIIELKIVNLNDVIESIKSVLGRIVGDDIRMKLSLAKNLGAVKIDPTQYEQVLLNLAANSRDAMPDGGELSISTTNVVLDREYCAEHRWAAAGNYILLSVTDTGCGIPGDIINHVFEPFFTTKKGKGTGMGLSTVYGIVKHGGGNIDVSSEPEKGTNVRIYIPRVDGRPIKIEREAPVRDLPPGGETILVVEDEEMVMKLAVRMLRQLGYRVLQASSGEDALNVVSEFKDTIDMLLTDLVLPGMDGHELSQRILSLQPGIRVLYTSGYTEDLITRHGVIESGVNFLAKPYTPQILSQKIREVLEKDRG